MLDMSLGWCIGMREVYQKADGRTRARLTFADPKLRAGEAGMEKPAHIVDEFMRWRVWGIK